MSAATTGAAATPGGAASASPRTPAPERQTASERPAGLLVDFDAVGPDGTPVAELQPADIDLRINGKRRTIRALRRVSTAPPFGVSPGAVPATPPAFGTNDTVSSGRSFVILIDEDSLLARHTRLLTQAVDGLVSALTPADQAMVAALPFGGVKTGFTSDPVRLRLAVAGVAGKGTAKETGSELACRTRRFLESLDQFLASYAGRSSPLTVVLYTAGLAGPRRDAAAAQAPGMCELLVSDFHKVAAAAGAARANFYVVQPDDITTSGQRWRETIGGAGYLGSDNPLEGIENLAGVTAGVRLPLSATGTRSLHRVLKETSGYFVAEIEREPNEMMGRSRPLSVRSQKRDVTVRARSQITFSEPAPGARPTRLALAELLLSQEAFADVPLRAAGFTVREPDGRLRLGILVEPGNEGIELAAVGAVLLDGGDVVARWIAGDTLVRPLMGAVAAKPGPYRLRVVAIDGSGRVGAAEVAVTVGLTAVGPLSLGSLMLGVSRQDTLVPQLQFSSEPSAIASFDIYGGEAGMRMAAAVEVAHHEDGPALLSLPLALQRAGGTRVLARGAVPIGALPAGDYVIRGVIRLDDGTTGRVLRTLRKVPQ